MVGIFHRSKGAQWRIEVFRMKIVIKRTTICMKSSVQYLSFHYAIVEMFRN